MTPVTVTPPPTCSTSAGFQFDIAGGWHSALSGVLASIVFVAIVFVLTNDPQAAEHRHERGPSLRILFVTFFVFLVASFLWATVAGFGETVPDRLTGDPVAAAVQPVLAVPAAWLLSIGVVLLFFAVNFLVSAYEGHRERSWDVAATAARCFRLIAWLTAVEVWIAIETATRALAGRGWWYSPGAVAVVTVLSIPFLFADRIAARMRSAPEGEGGPHRTLGQALGFIGAAAVALVVFFAAVSGQPDSTLLHEGHWCGDGLPWPAAIVALTVMGLFLGSIGALARALPPRATPPA
jgi:hypothetical protein